VKHAESELQPLNATLTALYRTREKITITVTQGEFNPKLLSFLLSGKVQAARTTLRAPAEKSETHLQLLKRGGRSRACLGMNHVVTSLDREEFTQG